MVHCQHRVELAGSGAHVDRVGRVRTAAVNPLRVAGLDGRAYHIELLAPKDAAVSRMGVEPGHSDPAGDLSRRPHRAVSQNDSVQDRFDGQQGGDPGQRHMGRYTPAPQPRLDVELRHLRNGKAQTLGRERDFVLIGRIGLAHGALIERRVADRVDKTGGAKIEGFAEISQGRRPARLGGAADFDRDGIDAADIQKEACGGGTPGERAFVDWRNRRRQPRFLNLAVEKSAVADDEQAHGFSHCGVCREPGGQHRTNAGRIANHKTDKRLPHSRIHPLFLPDRFTRHSQICIENNVYILQTRPSEARRLKWISLVFAGQPDRMTAVAATIRKVSRQTLHTEVASQLRDLIVQGHFRPGEKMNEVRLGIDLGVSRTPLREAIRTLGSEGLLELVPNRGAIVRTFSLGEVLDMIEALGLIEQGCAGLACERASDGELRLFDERNETMIEAYKARDRLHYFQINQELHAMIVGLARNNTFKMIHADLQAKLKHIRFLGNDEPNVWVRAVTEHNEINKALQSRDGAAMMAVLGAHKTLTIDRIRNSVTGTSI
jgi:DNA-binding GntR family transcriptional regulator